MKTRALWSLLLLSGCTSVKLSQREGCWVRETKTWPGRAKEEVGPCAPPAPRWSEDRLSRLVQECAARADTRWESRALAAWQRGEPMPDEPAQQNILQQCMNEAARSVVGENESLKQRLSELSADRSSLAAGADEDRKHLRATSEKLAEYLGEAAKKTSPPAVATATASSDGQATTENTSTGSATGAPGQAEPVAPAFAPAARKAHPRPARTSKKVPPATAAQCTPARCADADGLAPRSGTGSATPASATVDPAGAPAAR